MTGSADHIERAEATLEQRGLPADSFFIVEFADGSVLTGKEANWSAMSREERVGYFGGTKTVFLCDRNIRKLSACHGDLRVDMDVPYDCEAYQSVRSEALFVNDRRENRIIGRAVGIVRDGQVVEERIINAVEGVVTGMKI